MTEQTGQVEQKRECGNCAICCIFPANRELNKPAGVACQHMVEANCLGRCGIYEERPKCCRTYKCSWLEGRLPIELRPDRSGMLVETLWSDDSDGERYWMLIADVLNERLFPADGMQVLERWMESQPNTVLVLTRPSVEGMTFMGEEKAVRLVIGSFQRMAATGVASLIMDGQLVTITKDSVTYHD